MKPEKDHEGLLGTEVFCLPHCCRQDSSASLNSKGLIPGQLPKVREAKKSREAGPKGPREAHKDWNQPSEALQRP